MSKHDIFAALSAPIDFLMPHEEAALRKQARLQAAFCDAFEAEMRLRRKRESTAIQIAAAQTLTDSAWIAIENHFKEQEGGE